MTRFTEEQLEALYSGKVTVRTNSRPVYLRVATGLGTFVGTFKETQINQLVKSDQLVELPPFTDVTCVKDKTVLLLKKFSKGTLRFVYVKAKVEGKWVEGLMPKGVLHDYAYGALHPMYTGVTYGGYKTAFCDSHQIVNFQKTARCSFCELSPNDHKLYETQDALDYARRLLHALYENQWAGFSAHMLGVLYAFSYEDYSTYVYAAYSGELTTHDTSFQLVLATLDVDQKKSSKRNRTWRFARTLKDDDPHLIWDGTDTIGNIRNLPKNGGFKMDMLKCAAPKLIQAAHRDKCIPIAMSEIWYYGGNVSNKTSFLYGCSAESCNLCRMSIPPMLCHRDAEAVTEEIQRIF